MVIGRELSEWRRQAWLVASVGNLFRSSPISPDRINPYLAECRTRGVLDEEPAPRSTPFDLGDISTLARAMRGNNQ